MKKAFSLIELMIVIVIIGVVYTLAITKLQNFSVQKATPTLANLKEYLLSYLKNDDTEARLLCLDRCGECAIYVDGVKIKSIENFVDSSIERYRYDFLQGAVALDDTAYFNDEDVQKSVCFSFSVTKDGISDQILVAYKDKIYDYTSYFEKSRVYNSLQATVEKKQDMAQEIMR